MAKITMSIAGTASGKMGGLVFSRNKYGQYLRQRVKPVNPRSAKQTAQRSLMAGSSAQWKSLTDLERAAWQALAANVKVRTRKGEMLNLSGQAFFVRTMNLLDTFWPSQKPQVPTTWQDFAIVAYTLTATAASAGPPPVPAVFDLHFTSSMPDHSAVIIQATPELWPGITYLSPSIYRTVLTDATGDPTTLHLLTPYQTAFGALISGRKIEVRVMGVALSTLGGNYTVTGATPWRDLSTIVT